MTWLIWRNSCIKQGHSPIHHTNSNRNYSRYWESEIHAWAFSAEWAGSSRDGLVARRIRVHLPGKNIRDQLCDAVVRPDQLNTVAIGVIVVRGFVVTTSCVACNRLIRFTIHVRGWIYIYCTHGLMFKFPSTAVTAQSIAYTLLFVREIG